MDPLLRSTLPLSVNLNRYETKVATHIKLPKCLEGPHNTGTNLDRSTNTVGLQHRSRSKSRDGHSSTHDTRNLALARDLAPIFMQQQMISSKENQAMFEQKEWFGAFVDRTRQSSEWRSAMASMISASQTALGKNTKCEQEMLSFLSDLTRAEQDELMDSIELGVLPHDAFYKQFCQDSAGQLHACMQVFCCAMLCMFVDR